jgi:hypothetical protein
VLDLEKVETAGEREGPVRLRESAGWEREGADPVEGARGEYARTAEEGEDRLGLRHGLRRRL